MLTSAQSWRRLKSSRTKQRLKHAAEYENECNVHVSIPLRQDISKISSLNPTNTTVEQTTSTASSPSGRRVKFSSVIRVCLVPCRSDFQSDFHTLFWMREDYQTFKEDAVRELRAHWLTNRTTVKEAIIDLYQPNAADYAASKSFLSHVDSVAHLRLAALEGSSPEGLLKLPPQATLNAPDGKTSHSGADKALCASLSSQSSESGEDHGAVETWSPTSTDTDAALMGEPLSLDAPHSGTTLLGQVTAPHIDPITPIKSEASSEATRSTVMLAKIPHSPTPVLTVPVRGDSKPSEGLRIILMEESPASSISSFETPIMIYGQS